MATMNLKELAPRTSMQALIEALYQVRPPALGTRIESPPGQVEVVRVEFVLTPELVKAWGELCAAMNEAS